MIAILLTVTILPNFFFPRHLPKERPAEDEEHQISGQKTENKIVEDQELRQLDNGNAETRELKTGLINGQEKQGEKGKDERQKWEGF